MNIAPPDSAALVDLSNGRVAFDWATNVVYVEVEGSPWLAVTSELLDDMKSLAAAAPVADAVATESVRQAIDALPIAQSDGFKMARSEYGIPYGVCRVVIADSDKAVAYLTSWAAAIFLSLIQQGATHIEWRRRPEISRHGASTVGGPRCYLSMRFHVLPAALNDTIEQRVPEGAESPVIS